MCTQLPYRADDDQQIERKRHIGNDNVVIIFRQFDAAFDPKDFIVSHQIKVYVVVSQLSADFTGEDISKLKVRLDVYYRGVQETFLYVD